MTSTVIRTVRSRPRMPSCCAASVPWPATPQDLPEFLAARMLFAEGRGTLSPGHPNHGHRLMARAFVRPT